jgi:UDP-N-acetylmuramoyl-tripeptide--D-alanyl-D-alanine ligase
MITADQKFEWSLDEVIDATGGWLVHGQQHTQFDAVSIDSRKLPPGRLFVAIVGEKHDGHDFIPDAIANGARGVMVAESWLKGRPQDRNLMSDTCIIAVEETTQALGNLAAYQRRKLPARVVAITGSNGKTTTRRMTATAMEAVFATLATSGNLNNHIGLPLTLFQLQPHHQWAVVEIGMNHFGEIARLSELCRPDIGVITNIAPSHLEGVGDIAGVLKAKSEIVQGLSDRGVMVLNADDDHLVRLADKIAVPVITFGLDATATVRARDVRATVRGFDFTLCVQDQQARVELRALGRYMVSNALAAAAVGVQAGIAIEAIAGAIGRFEPLKGRLRVIETSAGITFIDDTYNANPGSVGAALSALIELEADGRKFLVLGDMLELGDQTRQLHRQVGARTAAATIDGLFVTGAMADEVAAGAQQHGMPAQRLVVGDKSELIQTLKALLLPGDCLLIKGSRGMTMETVLDALVDWAQTAAAIEPKVR